MNNETRPSMWLNVNNGTAEYTINVAQIAYFKTIGSEHNCALYAIFGSDDTRAAEAIKIMEGTREECVKLRKLILKNEDVSDVV